ncbi:hypothetical protein ES703_80418 [subsurface metagenome]
MKKIIYLSYIDSLELMIGVLKKLNNQTGILKELGMQVTTSVLFIQGEAPKELKYVEFHKISSPSVFFSPLTRKIYGFLTLWNRMDHFLSKKSFDLILMRYTLANSMHERFIRKYGKFMIVEHQTKEVPQFNSLRSFSSFVGAQLEKRYGKRILEEVKGITGVTPEIIDYELSRINTFKPHAVISNGVNTGEFPLSRRPFYDGKKLSLVFVGGKEAPWHGIDRLLKGIALYNKKTTPRISLHLVGNLTRKTKKLVKNLEIEDRVYFHGTIYEGEIDKIFDLAHIAIGTLAFHRIQMKQACPLKVREYTARGVPFVIAYDDIDLEDNLPFYLRLPSDNSPIDMEKIVRWADNVLKDKDIPFYMREYALNKMDWRVKMKQLKDFLEAL